MDRLRAGRLTAAFAAAIAVAIILIGGALHPGYSHVGDYISELGAIGAPNATLISLAGFLPIGVLIIGSLMSMASRVQVRGVARVGYWLLLANGVSYIGAAFAQCDLGCPAVGSDQQALHNLLGLLGYGGSGVGLLLFAGGVAGGPSSRTVRSALRICGVIALACLVAMGVPDAEPVRGLIQRIAECALFGALLLIAWRLVPPYRDVHRDA